MPDLLPLLAAFAAGALNAVAGGGSFLTLPALIMAGVPPVAANATGTAALLPGYASAAWAYRRDMRPLNGLGPTMVGTLSLVGGAVGALLLLATPDATFRALAPWLILIGTILFAAAPYLTRARVETRSSSLMGASVIITTTLYGGYFNGGLGILLLAAFSLLGERSLNAMNGLKNVVSFLLTAIAVVVYALGGSVVWTIALPMMAVATLGGFLGAAWGRRVPPILLRWFIVAVGTGMTILFFAGL